MNNLFKLILDILASRARREQRRKRKNVVLRQQINVLRQQMPPRRRHLTTCPWRPSSILQNLIFRARRPTCFALRDGTCGPDALHERQRAWRGTKMSKHFPEDFPWLGSSCSLLACAKSPGRSASNTRKGSRACYPRSAQSPPWRPVLDASA